MSDGDATTLCSNTSRAVSRAMPLFSASSNPSEKARYCTARLRLTAIFMVTARPFAPTWVTFGPMSCKIGLTCSTASASPPTMIERLPCSSVNGLPETGASSICAPVSATRAASARLALGLTVLIST